MRFDSLENTRTLCTVYYLIPNPYQFFFVTFGSSRLFPLCLRAFVPFYPCSCLHKSPVAEVRQRLADFLLRVHDERAVGDDGFVERRPGDEDEPYM